MPAKKIKAGDIDIAIIGEDALLAAFAHLAKDATRRKIMRPAIGEAASAVAKAARARVPVETGLLKKSIGTSVKTTKKGNVVGVIGPRRGFKQQVNRPSRIVQNTTADPTKYAHLVEFGTAHSAPQAFLRPAMDTVPRVEIIRKRAAIEMLRQQKLAIAKGKTLR